MSIDPIRLAVVNALAKQRHKYQEKLEALSDGYLKDLKEIKKLTNTKPTKLSRTNDRTAIIKMAIKNATIPNDPRSALAELRSMAMSKTKSKNSPLLEFIPNEKEFKWSSGGDEAVVTLTCSRRLVRQ